MFWAGRPEPEIVVSLSPRALPHYAFYSIVRIGLAYLLSLLFAISYGYIAAYNRRAEKVMIAILDILQSIPVLSFLPPVMLAMIALFPTRQLGVEMGAIVLIFTGSVWNMAFSFYSSLKSIPKRADGSDQNLLLLARAASLPAGAALRRHRSHLELHHVRRRRLVLPHGVRDVPPRFARLPPSRPRLLSADRRRTLAMASPSPGV